jgi:uncharacterized membrane protein YphA (DoxX/SURF4 family)
MIADNHKILSGNHSQKKIIMETIIRKEREGKLENIGTDVLRYGLVIVLLWVGFLKFSAYEAEAIKPLVENSLFLSWVYNIMSVQVFAKVLGVIEIILAILIATRQFSPKLSAIGSKFYVNNAGGVATRIRFSLPFTNARSVFSQGSSVVGRSYIYSRRSISCFSKYQA